MHVGLVGRRDGAPLVRQLEVALETAAASAGTPWTRVLAPSDLEAARTASARGIATLLDVTVWRVGDALHVALVARDTRPNVFSGADLPARPPLFELHATWPLDATTRELEACARSELTGALPAVKIASFSELPTALTVAFLRSPTEPLLIVAGTETLTALTLKGAPVASIELPRSRSDTPARAPFTRLFAAPSAVDLVDGRLAQSWRWSLAQGLNPAPPESPSPAPGRSLWVQRTDGGVIERQRRSDVDGATLSVAADGVTRIARSGGPALSLAGVRGESALARAADDALLLFTTTALSAGSSSWRLHRVPDSAASPWVPATALATGEFPSGVVTDAQALTDGEMRAVFVVLATASGSGELYRVDLP